MENGNGELIRQLVRQKRRMSVIVTSAMASPGATDAAAIVSQVEEEEKRTAALGEQLMNITSGQGATAIESKQEPAEGGEGGKSNIDSPLTTTEIFDHEQELARDNAIAEGMPREDANEALATFRDFDENGDGTLQTSEIKILLIACCPRLRPYEADKIAKLKVSEWGKSPGVVTLPEFLRVYSRIKTEVPGFDPNLRVKADEVREERFVAEGGDAAPAPENAEALLQHLSGVSIQDAKAAEIHHDHDCKALGHDPMQFLNRKKLVKNVLCSGDSDEKSVDD